MSAHICPVILTFPLFVFEFRCGLKTVVPNGERERETSRLSCVRMASVPSLTDLCSHTMTCTLVTPTTTGLPKAWLAVLYQPKAFPSSTP